MRKPERKAPRGQRDMSRAVHEWRFEVGSPDHGGRLDAFLRSRISWRSRERVQRAIADGRVEIQPFKDKQRAPIGRLRSGMRLRLGQEVVVRLPAPRVEVGRSEAEEAGVVFEDQHLIAISKPAHRNVYPSRRHRANSLIEWVHARHRQAYGEDQYFPTPCHRLDRETSGLVLFAKSRRVRSELSRLFEDRALSKRYLAVVEGRPQEESGVIDSALGPDSTSRVEMKVGIDAGGQGAVTLWRRLRTLGPYALLELEPKSGRRHQLRVHLKSIGHPIVGDKLYGGGDDLFLRSLSGDLTEGDRQQLLLGRHALHAWRLEFRLDCLGSDYCLEAPLAPDLARWIETLDDREVSCHDRAIGF